MAKYLLLLIMFIGWMLLTILFTVTIIPILGMAISETWSSWLHFAEKILDKI